MQKCYDLAEKYYKKAISLNAQHSMEDSMGLAGIYIASGKIRQAKKLVDNMALHSPTAYGVNLLYGDIYKFTGNYEKALYFKEFCFEIVDSLSNAQSKAKILEVEKKYNHLKTQEENGRLKNFGVLDSYDSRFAAFERGSSFVISLDGPWYQKLDNTMRLFSYESRHYLPQDATQKAKAGISFDLLLTIDRQGRLGVEVLRPKQLSEDASRQIAHLRTSLAQLPPWSLAPLYTLDNHILPGRYVRALYAHDHWVFEDYLQRVIP